MRHENWHWASFPRLASAIDTPSTLPRRGSFKTHLVLRSQANDCVAESKNKFETRIACRRWRQTEKFLLTDYMSPLCVLMSFYNWILISQLELKLVGNKTTWARLSTDNECTIFSFNFVSPLNAFRKKFVDHRQLARVSIVVHGTLLPSVQGLALERLRSGNWRLVTQPEIINWIFLPFFSLSRNQYVPWAQSFNLLHRLHRWHPTTMCSDIFRLCMRATMLKCLAVLRARTRQARRRSRMASPTVRLGIHWPAACKTTTMSGSVATRSRSRSHAASSRRLTSLRSTGQTISFRWWSSWPKPIEEYRASFQIKMVLRLKKHPWRSRVVMLVSSRQNMASSGEFFFREFTSLRFVDCDDVQSRSNSKSKFCFRRSTPKDFLPAKLNSWW